MFDWINLNWELETHKYELKRVNLYKWRQKHKRCNEKIMSVHKIQQDEVVKNNYMQQ